MKMNSTVNRTVMTPSLNGIDHFHLYVKDKVKSVKWYQEYLGFKVVTALEFWNDEKGPLTIEDESGIHLALFTRTNQAPSTSIAFKTTGEDFLLWQKHLEQKGLSLRIADHQASWSIYFKDPDENMHEITSYEHDWITANRCIAGHQI
jgi:catechol 2,3-dioxygenase